MKSNILYSSILVLIVGIFAVAYIAKVSTQPLALNTQSQLAAVDASDPHLIGWWKLDDSSASTAVADSSAAGHTGTASVNTSALSAAGKVGSSFNFSGANQSVDTGYVWSASDPDFTASAWFKTSSVSQSFFSSYNGQKGLIAGILDNGGRPECEAADSSSHFNDAFQNKAYNDGLWHHIACVMSAGTLTMYMDGTSVNQVGGWNGDYHGNSPRSIFIGGSGPEALDDVRIYNRALSAGEIGQLYSDAGGTSQAGTAGTTGTTQTAQTTAPVNTQTTTSSLAAPTNVTATPISSSQVNITWTPSSGNVSGYKVYRNTGLLGMALSNSFSSAGLNPSTAYNYTVAAFDASGNVSVQSPLVTATTFALGAQQLGYVLSVYKYEHAGQGTVTATANGSPIVNCGSDCSEVLPAGASITLTAVPVPGSSLSRWEDCPGATGNTCTIAMPNWNMSLGAVFTSPYTPKTSLSDIIHDGMTWVFTGDSFTTLNTYSAYMESYFELRNPGLHLHFRTAARGGSALGDLMDDPTINPHNDSTTGALVGSNLDGRFDRWVYGWDPDVVSVMFSTNANPTPQQFHDDLTNYIRNYVIPNHSTPVILGSWPDNLASNLGEGDYIELLSDQNVQVGQELGVLTGDIWHDMAPMMLANLKSPTPVNLDGLANNTDPEHLNEAATLSAATDALRELGADGDVSDVTIDAGAGSVVSASHAVVTGFAKNANSGVDFTRKDDRLPMAFDDLSRPMFQIDPQVLDMNRYMLTVSNLSTGTYDIYIDGVKSATVDSATLASGWNMTTMTQGPIHDQLVEVLGRIRDKEGASRTRLYGPTFQNPASNSCVPAGSNFWGVTGYDSNASLFDSPGYRGDALVAQLAGAKAQTDCLDSLIYAAVQPVARSFSIRKSNGTSVTDIAAPTVSITAPAAASTVSGAAVTVSAAASDNVGVIGVQFKLDGAALGAEDTVAPYSVAWNSALGTGGAHTLLAVARDAAGNRATSSPVTVTVGPAGDVTPPAITQIASSTNLNSATVTWTTNEVSDSQIDYGLTSAYGSQTALDSAQTKSHSQTIIGLLSNTVYHFRARSRDGAGNLGSSTPDRTFLTATSTPAQILQPGTVGIGARVHPAQDGTTAYKTVDIDFVPGQLGSAISTWNTTDLGFISQGPKTLNGVTYWYVTFDGSTSKAPARYDGWVDQNALQLYVTTSTVAPFGADRTVNMYSGITQAFSVDADDAGGDAVRITYPQTTAQGGRLILTSNLPVTQHNTSTSFNFIFVPAPGVTGSDSFQYTLTDGVNTSVPYTVTFNIAPVTSSTWIPPIGIPRPEFGIDDTYRMYDAPSARNSALTYTQNSEGGYYTHYVDNTPSLGCSDARVYGTASAPRCTIPATLPAGSVVEIHGGPYTYSTPTVNLYTGTKQQPIFIRGVGMPRFQATVPSRNFLLGNNQGGRGQYVIVEGLSLYSFGVNRNYRFVAFRNSDVYGDQDGGGTSIATNDGTYPILDNIVFFNNKVHDVGIWDPKVTAALCALDTLDSTGQTYCDRDKADTVFAWESRAENIWILDSDLYHSEGDSVQASAGPTGVSLDPNLHHVYIGRNEMYQNKQTATAFKAVTHIVVSQNDMWGIATSTSSTGGATGFSDDGPEDAWWLFNRIHDSQIGIKLNAGRSPGPYYFIGNVVYGIHDPYATTGALIGSYTQIGQAITDWHSAPTYFINNTVYDADDGLDLWTSNWTSSGTMKFSNNIISDIKYGYGIFNQGDKFATISNDLFDPALKFHWIGPDYPSLAALQTAVGSLVSNNIAADPKFTDPAHGDFSLQAGSPAINAGDSTLMDQVASIFYTEFGGDIRKDFNGNNRPSGGAYDIGAYEYGATGGTQPPPAVITPPPVTVVTPPAPPVVTPPAPPAPVDSDSDGVTDASDLCASTPAGRAVNSVGCPLPTATSFTLTPSLSAANLNGVSGLSVSNSFGKITWSSPVSLVHNGDRIDLDANISIGKGTITVNSPVVPELNKPATITFYNVVLSNLSALKILRDGAICPSCTGATYANGILTFSVPGFSTYSIFDDSAPADTSAPTISITSPVDGATVSGSISPVVSASDDTGVVGVQYKLDGADLSGESLTPPFGGTFDTTSVSNGDHTLLAVARDAAGNVATSAPVSITVSNTAVATPAPAPTSGGGGGGGGGGGSSPVVTTGGGGGGSGIIPAAISIADVTVSGSLSAGVTVSWGTNVPATSQVQFGPSAAYGFTASLDPAFVTSHSQRLAALSPNTLYHIQARSKDAFGTLAVSNDISVFVPSAGAVSIAVPAGGASAAGITTAGITPVAYSPITAWLLFGVTDPQVRTVQQILNVSGFAVSASGTGSLGLESTYFGSATDAALKRLQCAKLAVCSGAPYTTGYGATGPKTRSALNALGITGLVSNAAVPVGIPVAPIGAISVPVASAGSITTWLLLGTTNPQVKTLQQILNSHGYQVSLSGSGSPGNESAYFGPATDAALKEFQCAKLGVCSGAPYTTGYGATGPKTRSALNAK